MNRRLLIATVTGLVFGLLNCLVALAVPGPFAKSAYATLILGRGLMGFVIGISALKICWWEHGLLIGFVVSLPAATAIRLIGPMGTGLTPNLLSVAVMAVGLVIGVLIELITSVVFKAKA